MWNGRLSQEAEDSIWADDTGNEPPPQSSGDGLPPNEFYLPPPRPLVTPGSERHLPPIRPLLLPSVEVRQPPPSPYQAPAPLVYPYATTVELDRIIEISSSNASSYDMVPPIIDISSSSDSSYNSTVNQRLGQRSHGTSRRGDSWTGAAPSRVEAYEQGNAYDGHRAHFGSPSIHESSSNSSSHGEQFRSFEDRAQEPCEERYQDDRYAFLHLPNYRRRRSTSKSVRRHPYQVQYPIASDQESGPSGHPGGRENPSCAFRNLRDNPDWKLSSKDNSRARSAPLSHGAAMNNSTSSYESSKRTETNDDLTSGGREYTAQTSNAKSNSKSMDGKQTSRTSDDFAYEQHPRCSSYEADNPRSTSLSHGATMSNSRSSYESSERTVTNNSLASRAQDIGRTSNSRSSSKSVGGRQPSKVSNDFAYEQYRRGSSYEADDEAAFASEQHPRRGSSYETDDEATSSMGWGMPRPGQVAPASPRESNGPNLRGPGPSNYRGRKESPTSNPSSAYYHRNISPNEERENYVSETSRDDTDDATGSTGHAHSNYMLDSENSVNANHNNHSAMSNPHGYEESRDNPWARTQPRNME